MSTNSIDENQKSVVIEGVSAGDELSLRFPPFPPLPDGVTIVPFNEFKVAGYNRITIEAGEEVEVDGFAGLPTIKVLNEEEARQKRKAKKKRRTAGCATDESGRLIPWWEEWEEGEALRTTSITFNSNISYLDRVYQAADDFRVGRTWPEISFGVRVIWDQFRLYVGMLSSIPIYKKTKSSQKGQVDGPDNGDEASDDEDDAPKAKQTNAAIVQDYLEQTAHPGKQLEPTVDDSTAEANLLRAFIDDMEKTVKTFLSSHMRDSGLIWTERNLLIAPTVLHFFLRFMLRNGVFADASEHLDNLRRAVAVAGLARKELPLTATLGQILPGQFDLACKECFGSKGSLRVHISVTPPQVDETATHDHSSDSDLVDSAFETELKEHDIEVIPSDVVLDSITAKQILEDNLDNDANIPVTHIPVAGDPWTAAILDEAYTTSSWTDVHVPSLMEILGPTVLPLTFSTGIVEFSTRRIRTITPPEVNATSSVVEQELERRFTRVVMCPWIHSESEETLDFQKPVIALGSNGAVVAEFTPDGTEVIEDDDPYDPYNDDVTVLIDQTTTEKLSIGMGLCGTWVQMRPDGKLKKRPRECYWYMEDLVATFPSFHTESDVRPEDDVPAPDDTDVPDS
ncbi:hypothetical protein PAXRUDRAFT_33996 [Paxillus rubicundulus Ve08.2h10]|uniref:Uncharacterized protein n=1 Tax=Paxillus rubicundulus Ve08.2h10 TaxID=930991 RepID=A0A0D0D987_9AGAM|nr:hypothetical protein PAXRUDRAFT_33996 [Paxillus rubicundulus Ve08.2h10]